MQICITGGAAVPRAALESTEFVIRNEKLRRVCRIKRLRATDALQNRPLSAFQNNSESNSITRPKSAATGKFGDYNKKRHSLSHLLKPPTAQKVLSTVVHDYAERIVRKNAAEKQRFRRETTVY